MLRLVFDTAALQPIVRMPSYAPTELGNYFGFAFYKYAAPMGLGEKPQAQFPNPCLTHFLNLIAWLQ